MSESAATLELTGNVAVLTLNRPRVHNAVDQTMMAALEHALDRIEQSPARAVVLTAAGERSFCAGSDLRYFATLTEADQVRAMCARIQAILDRLYLGERPVIAAVNGNAHGGGCEILSACHLRLAPAEVRFQFKQAGMGVVTGWGGAQRLFRLLGTGTATRLLVTGRAFGGDEAVRLGFVDMLVPAEQLMAEAVALGEQIAAGAPLAVSSFLSLARAFHELPADQARALETDLFVARWSEPWFQQAMTRFITKK